MGEPVRIQRKRIKGWKMPPNTVSVTRPGKWGNPFTIKQADHIGGTDRDRAQWCVDNFRDGITGKLLFCRSVPTVSEIQSELRGKNLACFCALDQPCHADVLLEIANAPALAKAEQS